MSNAVTVQQKNQLSTRFSEKFGVEPSKLMNVLKNTAFKQRDNKVVSDEQLCALMIVADKYDLNPFVKEIYAYPDKSGGIVPIIGVDGWNNIMNRNNMFDGIEFEYSENIIQIDSDAKPCPEWVEARIYIKHRSKPVVVREYLDECYKPAIVKKNANGKDYKITGPWQTHPKRFMRHKASGQCARIAFGFGGIYDEDEADNILKNDPEPTPKMVDPEETEFFTVPETKPESPKRTRKTKSKQDPIEEAEIIESEPEQEPEQQTVQEPEEQAPPMVEPEEIDLFN